MKCKVCNKNATGTYCELHGKAYTNVVEGYKVWKKALKISWKEYLSKVKKNEHSGTWVKEIARDLLSELE